MSLSVAAALQLVQAVFGLDFSKELAQIESGDMVEELTTVEDVANVVSAEIPDAKYVADVAELLILIAEAQAAGIIKPAQPEDPSMQRASGHDGLGRDRT